MAAKNGQTTMKFPIKRIRKIDWDYVNRALNKNYNCFIFHSLYKVKWTEKRADSKMFTMLEIIE